MTFSDKLRKGEIAVYACDPGATGAVCRRVGSHYSVFKPNSDAFLVRFLSDLQQFSEIYVFVEEVDVHPQASRRASFSFGIRAGEAYAQFFLPYRMMYFMGDRKLRAQLKLFSVNPRFWWNVLRELGTLLPLRIPDFGNIPKKADKNFAHKIAQEVVAECPKYAADAVCIAHIAEFILNNAQINEPEWEKL